MCTSTISCLEEPKWTNPWIVTLQAALSGKGSRAHRSSLPAQTMATFTSGTVWRSIFPSIIFVWTSIDCIFLKQMSLLLCNPSPAPPSSMQDWRSGHKFQSLEARDWRFTGICMYIYIYPYICIHDYICAYICISYIQIYILCICIIHI